MSTTGSRPPLTDEDGEAREITIEDLAHARNWRPGDPQPLSRVEARVARLRATAEHLRAEAALLDREADAIAAADSD